MDTLEEVNSEAMVDSGATGDFIERAKLPTRRLSAPVPVYNVDGSLNEAGSIDRVVDILMTYERHLERILLAVTKLGKQSLILGMTWLSKHNPEIDFIAKKVEMTRCSPRCCVGCHSDLRQRCKTQWEEIRNIDTCRSGPLPAFVEDADDEDEETAAEPTDPSDEPLEEGDRVWATGLLPEPEYIHASSTISQRLAEAFKRNSEPLDYEKHIPPSPLRLPLCVREGVLRRSTRVETLGPRSRAHPRCDAEKLQGLSARALAAEGAGRVP